MPELLVIDPGGIDSKQKTTGWACFLSDDGEHWHCARAESAHAATLLSTIMLTGDLPAELKPVVLYESYATYPGAKGVVRSEHPTAQTIGALKFIANWNGLTVHVQQPSIKVAGTTRMAKAGIEFIGKNQHARDAEMHGWYWLLTHGGIPQ